MTFFQFKNQYFGGRKVPYFHCCLCTQLFEKEHQISTSMFPNTQHSKQCTIMLLRNLASVEWVQVNCSLKLLKNIFCADLDVFSSDKQENMTVQNQTFDLVCLPIHFQSHLSCLSLSWFKKNQTDLRQINCWIEPSRLSDKYLFFLEGTPPPPPALLFPIYDSSFSLKRMRSVSKLSHTLVQEDLVNVTIACGFYPCVEKPFLLETGDNVHEICGYFVSSLFVSGSNEQINSNDQCNTWLISRTEDKTQGRKATFQEGDDTKVCSYLHKMDIEGNCQALLFPHFKNVSTMTGKVVFTCKNQFQLERDFINDLVGDCGPDGEDEPALLSLLQNQIMHSCSEPHQVPCREGHTRCLYLQDICYFQLDMQNNIFPCRTGEHLAQCMNFQCNMKYKCPQSYCIVWSHVADGKWDCPSGGDETSQILQSQKECIGMFKR